MNGNLIDDPNHPVPQPLGTATMDVYWKSYLVTPYIDSGDMPVPTDADDIQNSRNSRTGLVFMLIAFFCFLTGNRLYFPKV